MINIKRGEIYMANLPKAGGSIQHGYRPVVVVQNNIGNKFSPTTIVVPITTKKKNKNYMPTHIKVNRLKELSKDSVVLCEQILTINQKDLDKPIGKLNRRKMSEINVALVVSIIPGLVEAACQMYKIKNRTVVEKTELN